jgi:hypothetical protein
MLYCYNWGYTKEAGFNYQIGFWHYKLESIYCLSTIVTCCFIMRLPCKHDRKYVSKGGHHYQAFSRIV